MNTSITGILNLSQTEYRALDAINKSGLDHINKSPAHFQYMKANPPEATPAMVLGTATHLSVLQPELLHSHFFSRPEGIDGRTKEGKVRLEELGRQNAGKTMLKADDFALMKGMTKAVRDHKAASRLLSGGRAEMTALCQDAEHDTLCKARPDYLTDSDIIVDLKTTENANFFHFQRKVRDLRYHVQAAWYLDTVNAAVRCEQFKRFFLIVVETDAPHGVVIYEMDQEAIRIGRMEARRNLETYVQCVKEYCWPGYPEFVQIMTVPVYE
jgi:hypothetical protein